MSAHREVGNRGPALVSGVDQQTTREIDQEEADRG